MERYISGEVVFNCELKIDGLAMSLLYEAGKLTRASDEGRRRSRRGRGPQNVATISAVPKSLGPGAPEVLEVRGEIFMTVRPSSAEPAAGGGWWPPFINLATLLRDPSPEGPRGDGRREAVVLPPTSLAK